MAERSKTHRKQNHRNLACPLLSLHYKALMESDWASEHLQVIRTLMERSALYRRALAPIMTVAGIIGLIGGVIPCFVDLKTARSFSLFWMAVSVAAALAAFVLVRRQALKEAEPFWSVPTRRVTQALAPPFVIGLVSGAVAAFSGSAIGLEPTLVAIIWIVAYGCGLSAAGFFMQRGIKLLGWIFVISGASLLVGYGSCPWLKTPQAAHYLMGIFFGLLHLAYGGYLYFTEKAKQAA